jgi:hypothetical protein
MDTLDMHASLTMQSAGSLRRNNVISGRHAGRNHARAVIQPFLQSPPNGAALFLHHRLQDQVWRGTNVAASEKSLEILNSTKASHH